MKELKTESLRPGMKFDAPVYIDDRNILVPPGIAIKEKDIERLKRWEIKNVRTEGELVRGSGEGEKPSPFSELIGFNADENESRNQYEEILTRWKVALDEIRTKGRPGRDGIDRIVNQIYNGVKEKKNEIVQLILTGDRRQDDEAANAVNCAVIAIIIGVNLKMVGHKVFALATAALLHDVGMLRIPEKILSKTEDLTQTELAAIHTHPVHSYTIIAKELKYPEEIAQIALYHHERWDGKGYPKGLNGEAIPLAARIVSVADAYIAMINERPYREQMIGYDAIKNIISDNFKRFDPNVVKGFLRGMGIYPIGSVVLLSDSTVGRVVSTHGDAPLRPKVEILINARGQKSQGKAVIDLLERGDLFVVRAVDPRTITADNE
ncbi:MAG: HD-GYP domain-containing protein [Spirochaetales bacterium]|nr:HD-GYP domain-containing protein [Spirochaetales bacterium]